VPRRYLELALLRCYHFLEAGPPVAALARLAAMMRGLTDPLASAYAHLYLARRTAAIAPQEKGEPLKTGKPAGYRQGPAQVKKQQGKGGTGLHALGFRVEPHPCLPRAAWSIIQHSHCVSQAARAVLWGLPGDPLAAAPCT
jgi:hypothetical protein